MELISSTARYDPVLVFRAHERGEFVMQMLFANGITRGDRDPDLIPDFVTTIKEKLQAKRSINIEQKVWLTFYNLHYLTVPA